MDTINIAGIDKAALLAALYNNARPQGMGFLHYKPEPMTTEQAREVIAKDGLYFDYLSGRVMKVDLKGDALRPQLYDRDNGQGACLRAIQHLLGNQHSGEA